MKRKALSISLVLLFSLVMVVGISSSALAGVTVYLNNLEPVADDGYGGYKVSPVQINGESYSSSLRGLAGLPVSENNQVWSEYNLGRKYEKFHGVVGIDDRAADSNTKAQFRIYGDSELLFESPVKGAGTEPTAFDVDIKNVLRLKIETTWISGNIGAEGPSAVSPLYYAVWGNPVLKGPKIVEMTIGNKTYEANDTEQTMDIAPYIKSGRTYLPVRYVGEALGATVSWNNSTQTAIIVGANKTTLVLKIGSKVMTNNSSDVQMDVAPEITSSRTMLPIRWVAEALGATVDWNQDTKLVTIKLP